MIAPEIKFAFRSAERGLVNERSWILANAFVEAEWRRRKAEFEIDHALDFDGQCAACDVDGSRKGNDEYEYERHNWTDDQWRESVLAELREK